jgi:hypothetical protein
LIVRRVGRRVGDAQSVVVGRVFKDPGDKTANPGVCHDRFASWCVPADRHIIWIGLTTVNGLSSHQLNCPPRFDNCFGHNNHDHIVSVLCLQPPLL